MKGLIFLKKGLPGNPVVNAELADDNTKIRGDFSQSGMTFPILLHRDKAPSKTELNTAALENFSDFVEGIRKDWNTPGVAVGIVTADEVLFAE